MKSISFLAVILFLAVTAYSQVNPYSFSQSVVTYTEISSGTVLGDASTDDQRFVDPAVPLGGSTLTGVGLPIGFNFNFNSWAFDRFAVNANGWISLGNSGLTPAVDNNSSSAYTPFTSTSTHTPAYLRSRIGALTGDLQGQAGSSIMYETTGTAPNRILVVQWKNYRKYTNTGDNFNFQIRLHETTNLIEVVYGTMTNNATGTTVQVGLGGSSSGDYNLRQTTTNWNATSGGTANTANCTLSGTVFPASGTSFLWTPASCYVPTFLTVSGVTTTGANLSWTAPGTGTPAGYEWKIVVMGTGVGAPAVDNGTTVHPVVSASTNALSPASSYDLYVRTDCGGGDLSNWEGPYTFYTLCGAVTAPYSENFDGVSVPNLPNCWNKIVVYSAGTPNVQTTGSTPFSSPNCAQLFNSTASGSGTHLLLITPQFSDLTSQNTQIRFRARFTGSGAALLNIGTMSDPANQNTFTLYQSLMTLTSEWQEFIVPFSVYAGTNEIIAFKHGLGLTNQYIYIDDFIYETIPTCPQPSALSATGVTGNSANLNWISNGSETLWNIEWGLQGFTPGTGTLISGVTSSPYPLTGIGGSTSYSFYVQADCGGGDLSSWSGPYSFTTLCAPIIPNWTESFNTFLPLCWIKAQGALAAPVNFTSTVTSYWIEDGYANVGSTGSARINIYSTGRYEWLITPPINLGPGTTTYQLEFDLALTAYAGTGPPGLTGTDDRFAVVISPDSGTTWSSSNILRLWDNAGSSYVYNSLNPAGIHVIMPLTSYTGYVKIGFYGESTVSNADNDLFIDNVMIRPVPTCPQPQTLSVTNITGNSADLQWVAGGSETAWDIEYGPAGFVHGTGTLLNDITANPYNLTGLNPQTTYQVYVMAQCDAADSSYWEGPVQFTTLCTTFDAPFLEQFNTTSIPNCWQISGPQAWLFTNTWPAYGAAVIQGTDHSGTGGSFAGVDGSGSANLTGITLLSPLINTSTLTLPLLNFWLFNNNIDNADYQTLRVDFHNGTTWIDSVFYWGPAQNSPNWEEITIPIYSLSITGPVQFRFVINKGTGSPYYDDIVIDDVAILEAPTCPKPLNLTAANVLDVSADLSWDPGYTETMWDIQWGPAGFVLGTGTIINDITSNPYNLSGLSPTTSYQYYVLAQCSPTDSSVWTGPYTFTTQMVLCTGAPVAGNVNSSANPVCPSVNFNLWLTGTTVAGGISFQWQSSPDGTTFTDITGAVNDTITTSQTDTTYYRCIVTCYSSGISDTTADHQQNVSSFIACYCTSNATSAADEDIFNVSVGTLNNSSTCSTTGGPGSVQSLYSDYTALTPPMLAQSTAVSFSVQIGTCGGNYSNGVAIWIDYNQNGLFTDPGEKVYNSAVTTSGPHTETGSFVVPVSATLGLTRMRVVNIEGTVPTTPCGTYTWGETEDYLVNIVPPPSCIQPSNLTATNITSTTADLGWNIFNGETAWDVQYGLSGFVLGTGTILNDVSTNPYQLAGLSPSTTYQYYVLAQCSPTDSSFWSGPYSFSTNCGGIVPPYYEPLATFLPNCWSVAKGQLAAPVTFTSTTSSYWVADGFANVGSTGSARLNIYSTGRYEWLISPEIDLGTGNNYALEFDLALTAYSSTGPPAQTGTDDKFTVVISTDAGLTWSSVNTLRQWDNQGSPYVYNSISYMGQHIVIPLTGYTGFVKIGFYGESTVSNADNDLFVDNVRIRIPVDLATVFPASATYNECGLTASNPMYICIKNTGAAAIPAGGSIYTWYKVNANPAVADTLVLSSNLAVNDSVFFLFSQVADLSAITTYSIIYWIKYQDDISTMNDTAYTIVVNSTIWVNIIGGDTVLVDPVYLPYELVLQNSPYTYDTYSWSNWDGSLTGTSNTFEAPVFGWYYITVTDGSCTATDSIYVDNLLLVSNVQSGSYINVYPNPSNGKFFVVIKELKPADISVKLYSSENKSVYEKELPGTREAHLEIDAGNLARGLYLLRISTGVKEYSVKVTLK